jgi:hypothetical protein
MILYMIDYTLNDRNESRSEIDVNTYKINFQR